MKKALYLLFFLCAFGAIDANAQLTIGSLNPPQKGAILELKSDTLGFLPPRVSLSTPSSASPLPDVTAGIVVFNINPTDSLVVGLYYHNGSKWIHLTADPYLQQNWFYMPSIVLDVSQLNTPVTVDLYSEFLTQFKTPPVISPSAPAAVAAPLPQATDLYYYVTGYDTSVFSGISITNDGKMTYTALTTPSDSTYMNIVFVEK